MNREFLEGLGLEKDAVNAIMAKHGSTIGAKETEIINLKNEKQNLDDKIARLEKDGGDDGDKELKKQLKTAKKANKELEEQLVTQAKSHALNSYAQKVGTNDIDWFIDKASGVGFEDGELVGIEEIEEGLREKHPLLFEADEPEPQEPQKPKPWAQRGNGTVTGGEWTKESIMAVEDVGKRQRLIRENKDLF